MDQYCGLKGEHEVSHVIYGDERVLYSSFSSLIMRRHELKGSRYREKYATVQLYHFTRGWIDDYNHRGLKETGNSIWIRTLECYAQSHKVVVRLCNSL